MLLYSKCCEHCWRPEFHSSRERKNTQKLFHTRVKILERHLMTKDFLWRLKLHVGNWNEWPLVLAHDEICWRQWRALCRSLAGISRSPTIVVAYLMTATSMGWQDALRYVRSLRPVVNPNLSFQRQLMHFEHSGQLEQVVAYHAHRFIFIFTF